MSTQDLEQLGQSIAALRIARNLKQAELAYEAGVSERTLQRIEAGEVVKSDGLVKVIRQLGRLDAFLSAVGTAPLSPNQLARQLGGAKGRQRTSGRAATDAATRQAGSPRKRVRHSKKTGETGRASRDVPRTIVWPEDQS